MIKLIKWIYLKTLVIILFYFRQLIYKIQIRWYATPKKLQKAIDRANKLHEKTGKRYRVFFLEMRYRALCREDIKERKQNGFFVYRANSTNLDGYKYYDTIDGKISI